MTRAIVMSGGLLAFGIVAALSLPTEKSGTSRPEAARVEPVLTAENAGELCQSLFVEPKEYIDDDARRRRWDLRRESCQMAFEADPSNADRKAAFARSLPYAQKTEAVAMWREAAAQGSAEANYQLYEHHRSWDRGDLAKVPTVARAEAARALQKAAELGHRAATLTLIRRLEDGDVVKRDAAAARAWAERAAADPANEAGKANMMVTLGRLLASSELAGDRSRGIEMLERASRANAFGGKRELAIALRKDDPVRARELLEEARHPDPGGAIAPLAEMLIAGEGGPADPRRALSLLKGTSDNWAAKGLLGKLTLEGRLVPRNAQVAVDFIRRAGTWDFDARMLLLQALAENPDVRIEYPERVLYEAVEAAELDEPGAMKALIDLKLSANPQFQDRVGACKLVETAISRDDQGMADRRAACRDN